MKFITSIRKNKKNKNKQDRDLQFFFFRNKREKNFCYLFKRLPTNSFITPSLTLCPKTLRISLSYLSYQEKNSQLNSLKKKDIHYRSITKKKSFKNQTFLCTEILFTIPSWEYIYIAFFKKCIVSFLKLFCFFHFSRILLLRISYFFKTCFN